MSQLNFEFGCRLANPGNANLPIGILCFGTVANREIGVPRGRLRSRSFTFLRIHFSKLGHYRPCRSDTVCGSESIRPSLSLSRPGSLQRRRLRFFLALLCVLCVLAFQEFTRRSPRTQRGTEKTALSTADSHSGLAESEALPAGWNYRFPALVAGNIAPLVLRLKIPT